MQLFGDTLLDFPGYVDGQRYIPLVGRHIQKSFVYGNGLYQVGIVTEYAMHLHRYLFIIVVTGRHNNQLGTETLGHHHRLGRVYPVAACLITGRAHHPTLTIVAHGHGFAAKSRIIPLLHRREESIHIHMYNLAHRLCKDKHSDDKK